MKVFVFCLMIFSLIVSGCDLHSRAPVVTNHTETKSAPSEPVSLSSVGGNQSVTLSWQPPVDNGNSPVTDYLIFRSEDSTKPSAYESTGSDQTLWIDLNVENGTLYTYEVIAVNEVGASPPSEATSSVPRTIPSTPDNLSAEAADSLVKLSWDIPATDGGSPVTGYRIYKNDSSVNLTPFTTTENTYLDESVTNGTTYTYAVSAINEVGESSLSSEATATPEIGNTVPDTVRNLIVRNSSGPTMASIWSSWDPPADNGGAGVSGYRVYRSARHLEERVFDVTRTEFTDVNLMFGVEYTYTVTAINAVGESARCSSQSATPSQPERVEERY